MKKILGILITLVVVSLLTASMSDGFFTPYNLQNLIRRTSLYGVLGIGVAFVIITGGIDLSIGSVLALVACLLPRLLIERQWDPAAAVVGVLALSAWIGLLHGLLITKVRLQPFVVTLCGLLLYRGIIRGITNDANQGFAGAFGGLRKIATGRIPIPFLDTFQLPAPFLLMVGIAIIAAVFLNLTIWGRYLFALGRNEQAARFSGINTDRLTILAYVICSLLAGVGGILFVCEQGFAQPNSSGTFYELYAIAAAVLGGCSLRGGTGSVAGILIGAALLIVLANAVVLLGISSQLEFVVSGAVILVSVIIDEFARRFAGRRKG